MPFGLRHWLAVVLGSFLLITFWALPVRHEGEWIQGRYFYSAWYMDRTPEYLAYQRVLRDMQEEAYTYQRLRWRDSLSALARTAREWENGVVVAMPEGAPEGYGPGLREAIQDQLLRAGAERPRATVGMVFMDARAMTHPQSPSDQGLMNVQEELFVSNDAANPFCIRVVPLRRSQQGESSGLERKWTDLVTSAPGEDAAPAPLGPCLLHAKYGTPGEGVFRWLWNGAYTFALSPQEPRTSPPEETLADLRRDLFGLRLTYFYSGGHILPTAENCLMGDDAACLRSVTESASYYAYWTGRPRESGLAPDGSPLAIDTRFRRMERAFGTLDRRMLWDLERRQGRERFQRFWSSDAELEDAFHAAFGEPLGAWVMEWAQGSLGPMHAAAPVPLSASIFTLFTVALFAGFAVLVRRRPA